MVNDISLMGRLDVAIKELRRIANALEKIAGDEEDA